jgi:hypothetical protein
VQADSIRLTSSCAGPASAVDLDVRGPETGTVDLDVRGPEGGMVALELPAVDAVNPYFIFLFF